MQLQSEKKLYSIFETYRISYYAFRSMGVLMRARKTGLLSYQFMERIMLAVTEVNGCDICSYAHTKMALDAGMSSEEIKKMLNGVLEDVPEEEIQGVLFAQHYASMRGTASLKTWKQLLTIYDKKQAKSILAASRVMMLGNTYGIAWSSFTKRFKRHSDPRSSLGYEFVILGTSIITIPIAIIHALIASIIRYPSIRFTE